MKVISIEYPTPLKNCNIKNDNIDICVRTKHKSYTFIIATIENLRTSIWLDKRGFIIPSAPILIVEELTKDIIEALLEELFKDKLLVEIYGKDI